MRISYESLKCMELISENGKQLPHFSSF